jgi:hypothetical protein
MPFVFKSKNSLGGSLPGLDPLFDIFSAIAPVVGIVQPLITAAVGILQAQKFLMSILMAPLFLLNAAQGGVLGLFEALVNGVTSKLHALRDAVYSGSVAKYEYVGTVGDMSGAFGSYFSPGEPGGTGPSQRLRAVFFVVAGGDSWAAIQALFTPGTPIVDPPPDGPPAPVSVTSATLSHHGPVATLGWVTDGTLALPVRLDLLDHLGNAIATKTIGEFGTAHTWVFTDTMLPAGDYTASVTYVHPPASPVVVTTSSITVTAPAPAVAPGATAPGGAAIPLPLDGGGITFLGRTAFAHAMPSMDGLVGLLDRASTALQSALDGMASTLGQSQARKKGIDAMIDYYAAQIALLSAIPTKLQAMLDSIGGFLPIFTGALSAGDIYIYKYDGLASGFHAAMSPVLDNGLPGDNDPARVVASLVIVCEDDANWAFVNALTGN